MPTDNNPKKLADQIGTIISTVLSALLLGSFAYTYNISNKLELVKDQMNRERIEDLKEINQNINSVNAQLSRLLGYIEATSKSGDK